MASRPTRVAPSPPPPTAALTAAGISPISDTITAAGSAPSSTEAYNAYVNVGWQMQAWAYYHSIGPLKYGLNWRAAAMSRISLLIAEVIPGLKEPIPSDNPAANQILNQIKWDESQIMSALSLQLDVPGRGYLVGREIARGVTDWCVYSPDQIRPVPANKKRSATGYEWELWDDGREWIPLTNALVVVVRDRDPRYGWLDISNTQGALSTLREIDLYNRDLVSSLVSRIANNGILLVPQEVSFPTREQYNDNSDPFMFELIEVAKQSIKDPGSASAAIPMPLKVPAQFIDKFKHLTLANAVDDKVLKARQEAYEILADTINLPKEIVTGISDVNHSVGLTMDLEEASIKMHIDPTAELICRDLTRGFLYPQMIAARQAVVGPNGGKLVIWFDTAALAAKPNLSDNSIQLYDRLELSGDALRRETGFTEDDAPEAGELRTQILKKIVSNAQLALTALAELSGEPGGGQPAPTVDPDSAEGVAEQDEAEAASEARGNVGAPTVDSGAGSGD